MLVNRLTAISKHSAQAVGAFKLRTYFCLLSVALGIASITIIVAATEGAYKVAFEMVERFGPDALLVVSGSEESRALGHRPKTIKLAHVDAVRQAFPTAYVLVPMSSMPEVTVSFRNRKHQTRIIGTTAHFSEAWTWPVIQGSDLTPEDVKGLRNVGLIGQELQRELFGSIDPVGKYMLVGRIPVHVVGVLSERGASGGGQNLDDRLVMPITTVMRKLLNESYFISAFRVRFLDQQNIEKREEELRAFLREIMGTPEDEPDQFQIVSPTAIVQFLVALTGSLVIFIGLTGIMCLIVAGFVLANLFLLSVKERAQEIGIRRAVGARKRDIVVQFLSEAVIITTAGGLTGFVLALGGSKLLTALGEFPIHFSWRAFAVGLVLSWIVGIAFGLQPALRAARVEPIEAIRQ